MSADDCERAFCACRPRETEAAAESPRRPRYSERRRCDLVGALTHSAGSLDISWTCVIAAGLDCPRGLEFAAEHVQLER